MIAKAIIPFSLEGDSIFLMGFMHAFVQIQVKQSKLYSRRGKPMHYWKPLLKKSFDVNKGENVFYIFVLKRGTETNYLIVLSLWLDANSEKFDLDKTEKYHLHACPKRMGCHDSSK